MIKSKINFKFFLVIFWLGIFFLVSAPIVSAFCFLISLIYSCSLNWHQIFKDKWNYLFITASLLMVLIAIFHSLEINKLSISIFEITNEETKEQFINWNSFSSLVGLSNWLQ